MGSGGLALMSGISQGFAQGQKDRVKNEYQKALIEQSKLQTKQLEQEMNLKNQAMEYVKLNPELKPVLMGLAKPKDPMEEWIMQELQKESGLLGSAAPATSRQRQSSLGPGMAELMPTIGEVAETNKLSPDLFANLINTESGGRNVQNAQGTPYWGPGQVGVDAARDVWGPGAKHPAQMTSQENVATAGAYFRQLLDRNNQDVNKALTHYGGFVTKDPSGYIGKVTGGQGLPDMAAQMQVQQGMPKIDKNKFIQGYLNKKYGYPEDEVQWLKGIAGPKGPISVGVDKRTGRPLPGLMMDESVTPQAQDVQGPGGMPAKAYFNPFDSTQQGGFIPQPFKLDTTKVETATGTTEQNRNPFTGEVGGGVQVAPPKGETSGEAGKQQLAATGVEALVQARQLLFSPDGAINKTALFNSTVSMPWSQGRQVSQLLQNAADAITRAATGAGMPETEMKRYVERYVPTIWDNEQTVRSKIKQVSSFLDGYLEKMDPTGKLRLRTGKSGLTPTKMIFKDGKLIPVGE